MKKILAILTISSLLSSTAQATATTLEQCNEDVNQVVKQTIERESAKAANLMPQPEPRDAAACLSDVMNANLDVLFSGFGGGFDLEAMFNEFACSTINKMYDQYVQGPINGALGEVNNSINGAINTAPIKQLGIETPSIKSSFKGNLKGDSGLKINPWLNKKTVNIEGFGTSITSKTAKTEQYRPARIMGME